MRGRTLCALVIALVAVWCVSCETDERAKQETALGTTEASKSSKQRPGPGPYEYERSIGSKGTEPGEFREPVGLAIDSEGNVYVPDTHNKRLQKLSPTGESLEVWAKGIERPMHIALGEGGRLLVSVFQDDEIRIFDGPGEPVETFGGDWLDAPAGVAQGPDGTFYVADFYNHCFHVVSEDGEREETIGEKGKEAGQFTYPTDLAVEPDGTIWVADAYAHRIQVFSPELEHERTIGGWGKEEPGKFRVATGIDVGPEGNLYVADSKNDRIQILEPDGTPVAIIDGEGKGDGTMKLPTEVVRTETKLYVTDHGHHQIDIYAVGGEEKASEESR